MEKKAVSGIILTLLLTSMLTLAFNIQLVSAEPTTWAVDDDGGADFYTIQEAINVASSGDTIFVYNGTYYENVVVNKTVPIIGENRENTVIDGGGTGTVVNVTANCVSISGFTIRNSGSTYTDSGIYVGSSSNNNTFVGNIVSNNDYGINLNYSSNNILSSNNASNNEACGISVSGTANTLVGNNASNNGYVGIQLDAANNNTLVGNNASNNGYVGIYLSIANNNTLIGNTVSNNWDGIDLSSSSNNTLIGNTASNNTNSGIFLSYSSNNTLFHNNFIKNTPQVVSIFSTNVWDDDYPSGGNYWSDYTGVDEKSGPNQDEIGSDGIIDAPHVIDGSNQDNYPLMEPWTPLPRTIGELKTEIEELGSEDEIDNQGIVKSLLAKLNVAQKLVDKGKVDEAETVLEGFIMQVQKLSGIHITVEAADILIQSAEYIISKL